MTDALYTSEVQRYQQQAAGETAVNAAAGATGYGGYVSAAMNLWDMFGGKSSASGGGAAQQQGGATVSNNSAPSTFDTSAWTVATGQSSAVATQPMKWQTLALWGGIAVLLVKAWKKK